MAEAPQDRAEQIQAFAQRWWKTVTHPFQAMAEWWTPQVRPEAHRQHLLIDTEEPDTGAHLRRDAGQQAPTVSDARADKAALRATVDEFREEMAQQRLALHVREIERAHAPEMDSGYRPARPLTLADRLAALEHALQAYQQAHRQVQATRQRDQGLGW